MPESMVAPAIRLAGVSRHYRSGSVTVDAVRDVSLQVAVGDAVAITGPSGSGKTTLLGLMAGLDQPSSGEVSLFGEVLQRLPPREITALRARRVGLVFQEPLLLSGLTALENVVVARLPFASRDQLVGPARGLLAAVGLEHRADFPPSRLSSGERQRVGIARAMLGRPSILLADEPTGNLDARSTEDFVALLQRLRNDMHLTIVVATHDPTVAALASRVLRLSAGRLRDDPLRGVSRMG